MHDGVVHDGVVLRAEQPWADARLAQLYDVFPFDADLPFYRELAEEFFPNALRW